MHAEKCLDKRELLATSASAETFGLPNKVEMHLPRDRAAILYAADTQYDECT